MRQKLGPKGNVNYLISKTGLSDSWIKKVSCGATDLQYRQAKLFELTFGFSADWLLGEDVPMMVGRDCEMSLTTENAQLNDGGAAFPIPGIIGQDNNWIESPITGMSLRDWFAGMALQGRAHMINPPHRTAKGCYAIADAMLYERNHNHKEESND